MTDNAPLREGKATAYEGGCRTPLIVMGPGIQPSGVNDRTPVNLIDLFPTFLAMAGVKHDGSLDLDGCNILPVMQGRDRQARFVDGQPRDTLYFHYPVLNGAFSTIRRGPWKLMKNTGSPMNPALAVQLFRLYHDDGSAADLGEQKNVAAEFPEETKQLLADLDHWLEQQQAGQPYRNADYKKGNLPGQKNVPAVTGRGSEGGRLWATFETGRGKAKIIDAFLLYTINPGQIEEWFQAKATVDDNRVTAAAPPGMTHAVFCLVDENNFLIHSEHVPGMQQLRLGAPVSEVLKDGYAYRPGLVSLVDLGRRGLQQAERTDQVTESLRNALDAAAATVKSPVDASRYAEAIRDLRQAIRSLDVAAARHPALNWFPPSTQ